MDQELKPRMAASAFSFRGYNVTNLGRTPELLEHPAFGPIVEQHLKAAGEILSVLRRRPIDLVQRVRQREEPPLEAYDEALCLISGASLAQLEILKQFFGVEFTDARFAMGYSLGEILAAVASNMYSLEALLVPILHLTDDCIELARDVKMGIVFSREATLEVDIVERLCAEVTARDQGTIGISTYLTPNTVLVLGQKQSLDLFKDELHAVLGRRAHFKENPHRWPPIHTPIVRQRCIADRASVMLDITPGGLRAPSIPIESCITGNAPYNDHNSRQILSEWVDHPQRLWSVIERLLNTDVHTLIHVGPEPNLLPSTMKRLAGNVDVQLNSTTLAGFGLRAVSSIVRARPWLAQYLSKNASLLRVPQIENVVLEEWLLAQTPT